MRTKHLPYYFNMDAPAGGDVDLTDVTPIVASEGDAVIVGPPGPQMVLVEDPPGTQLYDLRMVITMATRLIGTDDARPAAPRRRHRRHPRHH